MNFFAPLMILLMCQQVLCLYETPPFIFLQPPKDELLIHVPKTPEDKIWKPLILQCAAEGEPEPTYRWIKNGRNFEWKSHGDRITQEVGRGSLVIRSPCDEDVGQYQCFASNDYGTATSNSVFVRKVELNSFKDDSITSEIAHEGKPFKMTCHPPDGWPKPHVYWLLLSSNGSITTINNPRMTVDPEGSLWFTNVTLNDTNEDLLYVCAATSAFKNEYKLGHRIELKVIPSSASPEENKQAPVLQYVSSKYEVALRGSKIELFCIFGGTPLPEIVWTKNGRTIQLSERVTKNNFGKSLIISNVEFSDKGFYTCDISNGVGQAITHSVSLEVLAVPYFTVEPEIITAAEGEEAELHCQAAGVPEPQIIWMHNGLPISENQTNPRRTVTPNSIRIDRLTKNDTGNYGCNATNNLGYVYKDVYINVVNLKPVIAEAPKDK